MFPYLPKLPSFSLEWPDLSLPTFGNWTPFHQNYSFNALESAVLGKAPDLDFKSASQIFRKLAKHVPDQDFPERFDLEKWIRLFGLKPPTDLHFDDPQTCMPFLAFLGLAALLHIALGWGLYHYAVEVPQKEPEVDPKTLAMVAFAQQTLRDWRKNPGQKVDYWPIFLLNENPGKKDEELHVLIEKLASKTAGWELSTKDIVDPKKKVRVLTTSMYWDFFQHYARDYPRLSDFAEFGKGNCVAQTKLILPPLIEKVTLPSNEGFGVQTFKKHLAPVHYKKNEAGQIIEVRNLVSGKIKHEVVAPIYHPMSLIAAYVKAHGQEPVVSFEELLVEAPKPENIQKVEHPFEGVDLKADGLDFPSTEAEFEGDAPEDVFVSPPDWEVEATPNASEGSSESPSFLFENLPHPDQEIAIQSGIDFYRFWNFQGSQGEMTVFFRKAEDRDHYYGLTSEQDRRQFLLDLLRETLKRQVANPSFSKAKNLFSKPGEQSELLSESDLRAILELLDKASIIKDEVRKTLALEGKLSREDEQNGKYWTDFLNFVPEWKNLKDGAKKFTESFVDDPQNFILLFDRAWGWGKRNALFVVLTAAFTSEEGKDKEKFLESIIKTISNPELVGVEGPTDAKTPYRPSLSEQDVIEFENIDILNAPVDEAPVATGTGPAKILISRDSMVFWILRWINDDKLASRWKDEYAASFFAPTTTEMDRAFIYFSSLYLRKHGGLGKLSASENLYETMVHAPGILPNMKVALQKIKERKGFENFFPAKPK